MTRFFLALVLSFAALPAEAANVRVAAASNFVVTLEALAQRFEAASGHSVDIMAGSTGTLYAQITQGAPFDMFFAADTARPAALEDAGLVKAGTRVTYARGRLSLWAPGAGLGARMTTEQAAAVIKDNPRWRVATANPQLAPYGAAAKQAMQQLGIENSRLVYGQNIGQTYALVASGNAQAGFVARAQLYGRVLADIWPVPKQLHAPIDQDMVILKRASQNPAAAALHAYLLSRKAAEVLQATGYLAVEAD